MNPAGEYAPVFPRYRPVLLILAACIAGLAVAMHVPGHVSMDSSAQLYEAQTGVSVSWSPPLMSALLRWLGGGVQATLVFVVGCSALTYGGIALALSGAGRGQPAPSRRGGAVGALLIALAILNPLIFLYVGIVWKDVLFAGLFASAAGLLLYATAFAGSVRGRWLYFLAGMLLVPVLLVRQQGIVLAPPLLLACTLGVAGPWQGWHARRWWLRALLAALAFATACWGLDFASKLAIQSSGDKSSSVGYTAIQSYDVTGLIAAGAAQDVVLPAALSSRALTDAVRRTYSDERIDYVFNDPVVAAAFKQLGSSAVRHAWWSLISRHPDAYVKMKARQYGWLLDLYRLDRCLPVHLGVEGNPEYLAAVGIPAGFDGRDRRLFSLSMLARHLATHRHWFYLLLLATAAAWFVATRKRYSSAERTAVAAMIAGLALFYGSFTVTVLACDFRYLYPGLVGVTVLFVFLVSHQCLRGHAGGTTRGVDARRDGALP